MVFCNRNEQLGRNKSAHVTILILIDGFLQFKNINTFKHTDNVTILILIDGFLQYKHIKDNVYDVMVTILILIDGFLQCIRTNY